MAFLGQWVLLLMCAALTKDAWGAFSDLECFEVADRGLCQNVRYNRSASPNYRNGTSVTEIRQELETYVLLYQTGCSNAIVDLLCSYYFPVCGSFVDPGTGFEEVFRLPPCRELCLYVRRTCEPELLSTELISAWPSHFDCELFPSKLESGEACYPGHVNLSDYRMLPLPDVPGVLRPQNIKKADRFWIRENDTTITPVLPTPDLPQCASRLRVGNNSGDYQDYHLAGYAQCGVPCDNDYFSEGPDIAVPVVVIIFAILGILSTAFIIATAAIERDRFHYPERPIVFLAVCYFFISLLFMVGSSSKLANSPISCSPRVGEAPLHSFVFQHLPQSDFSSISPQSGGCVTVFFFLYWATMSSFLWFVILTFTWFLAATLKWAEEAISKFWLLYHIIAWGIPLIQAVIAMGVQLVDGDQHSGVCYLGNFNNVGLGVFVFMPMVVYLLLGITFLLIGFVSLIRIYFELAKDHQKSRHLQRLILRVSVFSALYLIPNAILVVLYIFELSVMYGWQQAVLCHEDNLSPVEECREGPFFSLQSSVIAAVLKYIMWLIVGVNLSCWVLTKKTYKAWRQLLSDIIPCIRRHISKYDIRNQNSSSNKV